MNDEKLIALMESSPDEARTALVEKYRNYVYAVVLSKLSGDASPDVIEDCVNDTFIEIFKSLPAYRGKGSLKAFIGTIASRTSLYKFRQQIRHKNSAVSIDDEDVPMIISDEDTESTVQDNAFRKRLWEIVDMLGEPDSRIIVYQYGYEFKIAEIAAMLSMTPAAVEKRSLRARKRIRKILENEKLI